MTTRRLSAAAAVALVVCAIGVVVVIVVRGHSDSGSTASCSVPTGASAIAQAGRTSATRWVTRDGSTLKLDGHPWRFSGVNMYWLGLDENVSDGKGPIYPTHSAVDNGFAAAAALGARVVRSTSLGVSVGSPRTLEPTLDHFNDTAFASIDYAVASARRHGERLLIPLTDDQHYYHGGKHTFTNWLGHADVPGASADDPAQRAQEAFFYSDPAVIAAFDRYVAHLLEHVNPLTGLRLGADPTIAVWETGNEVYDAPTSWTDQTAQLIKKLAPRALVGDGSASTGKDINSTAFAAADVDIIDAHFYPTDADKAVSDAQFIAAQRKAFIVGEYPLTGAGVGAWFDRLPAEPTVAGDLAWSLLPRSSACKPEAHGDGYTFHYPGAGKREIQEDALLTAHARRMAG